MHRVYLPGSLLILTLISFCLLSSLPISADDSAVSNVHLSVPVSCSMTSTVDTPHTATINPGTYRQNIGTTTFNVLCNDPNGFALYAIAYTDNVYGNNKLTATINGAIDHTYDISTSTATSGDTSSWAMELLKDGTPNNITIDNSYDNYNVIPTEYTKVASFTPTTTELGSQGTIKSTYAAYMSGTQHHGTYEGKVKYTLVYPANNAPVLDAYLDTGSVIGRKIVNTTASFSSPDSPVYCDSSCFCEGGGLSYIYFKAFKRSNTLPDNFVPDEDHVISLSTSPAPVYIWYDDTNSTVYYYTVGTKIYMNADSGSMFSVTGNGYPGEYYEEYWIASPELQDISGLADFDASHVTDMSYMFSRADISDLTPIANWDTSNVTNMSGMFSETSISDLTPIANWDTSNVTNMSSMFSSSSGYSLRCEGLSHEIVISNLTTIASWNTSNVTNMQSMFSFTQISDSSLTPKWNTANVTNMSSMFSGSKITDLTPLTNLDTSNATNMSGMFYDIPTLINPTTIQNWNVNKMPRSGWYSGFHLMFGGSTPKTNLPIFTSRPGTWDTNGTYIPNN